MASGARRAKCSNTAACSWIVPPSCSSTRKRRGPVIETACADSFPSWVCPIRAVIGLGTMNCNAANFPSHSERDRVSNSELLCPRHNNGSPGNNASMISSVCDSLSSKRTEDFFQRSTNPTPDTIIASRAFSFVFGHAVDGVTFCGV